MAADGVDALFMRVLEAHRDPTKVMVTQSQQDRMFPVQSSSFDEPFFMEITAVLSSDQQSRRRQENKAHGEAPGPHNFGTVQKKIRAAMRRFINSSRPIGVGHRAVVTASLGVLRRSCATTVPMPLSNIAVNVLLTAMENVACSARAPVTGNVTSRIWKPGSITERNQQQQQPQQPPCSPWRGPLELGGDSFPEAHMAAFLADATARIHIKGESDDGMAPVGSNAPPGIRLSAQLASKVIRTFGVGAPVPDHRLQWGRSPAVAESLKIAARRVAEKLRQEGDWNTLANLLGEMATWRGSAEAEIVLGIELRQLIASAMLAGKWEAARRAVSAAADGEPRRELARALIPSASDAYAFSVAKALIEENSLEKEFPELKEMERKRRLMAVVKKPGWKMAQRMLERGAKHEPQLRVWLTRYMIEQGDLPAAAQLMDHFNLHHMLPPLDPAEVESCARENAARHLQIPLADSRVFLVDGWESLVYSERALAMPPKVVGKDEGQGRGAPGAYCVGLDVESTLQESHATLLQVATSSEVFLFDLPALCEGRKDPRGKAGPARGAGSNPDELRRRFDDLIGALLANPSIVKLGFAFDQDLANLRRCWPQIRGFLRLESLLEIGQLSNRVLGEEHPSLSKTCKAWLGKPLDKTECASDWGHRPLTVDQVRYAALDAHCLVGIFEEMLLVGGGKLVRTGDGTANGWWRHFLAESVSRHR